MFVCTGFGDCSKVFTCTEHMARHIRKDTGERPFKCHCGRYYSRIDNLRIHVRSFHSHEPELNSRMMTELESFYKQLVAVNKKRQVAMGMVIKDRAPYPTRKLKRFDQLKAPLKGIECRSEAPIPRTIETQHVNNENKEHGRLNCSAVNQTAPKISSARSWEKEWRRLGKEDTN